MSRQDLLSLADRTGVSSETLNAFFVLTREAVRIEVRSEIQALLEARLEAGRAIPATRKYTLDELRVRLHTGRDPNTLDPDELADAEAVALSRRSIERLISSGEMPSTRIGGARRVSEGQVQYYERRAEEGRAHRKAARRGGKRRKS